MLAPCLLPSILERCCFVCRRTAPVCDSWSSWPRPCGSSPGTWVAKPWPCSRGPVPLSCPCWLVSLLGLGRGHRHCTGRGGLVRASCVCRHRDCCPSPQRWSGPEKLLALDELIDRCEPSQIKYMMQVIEPQFQRDFISLLPKEVSGGKGQAGPGTGHPLPATGAHCALLTRLPPLQLALYVLSFLEPRDLLRAAQTCRYWRVLAEDNLLWREKCREEGKDLPPYGTRQTVAGLCRGVARSSHGCAPWAGEGTDHPRSVRHPAVSAFCRH